MDSRELRAQRKMLVDEMRRIVESGIPVSEKTEKTDKIDADITSLEALIKRVERVETEERAFVPESQREIAAPVAQPDRAAQYRDMFWKYVRGQAGQHELRALSVGTDTSGGYTVPDEFQARLITAVDELNVMRGLATVIPSTSGTMTIPSLTTHTSAAWTAESAAYTETTPVFGELTFSAYKLAAVSKVSEELLNDSAFPLENWLANDFARALAEAEETAFVVGSGSGQPTGVVGGSTLGKTATATNAITADELMDTFHALGRGYRRRAAWLMHDSTVKAIRKLVTGVSGDKTYLWQPGLQAGEPDMLLGRPVYTSPDMAEIATGNKVALFGDFSYYWIVQRQDIPFQRLNELYAVTAGQVGFRVARRLDAKLTLATAVYHLKLA